MQRLAILVCVCIVLSGSVVAVQIANGDVVIDNAVIAHRRLVALGRAVAIYINDHGGRLDDSLHLVENSELSPEVFWHPGDNDPAPTALDNSIPNSPNSTQISFLFRTGDLEGLARDDIVIWDASPLNNAGRFLSFITADGGIETIPPVELPFPTNVMVAQTHLQRITRALWWYQYDHAGFLPDSLFELFPSSALSSPRSFWNPGDINPMPTDITNTMPDTPNSANISFDFPAAGMSVAQLTPETIILQDNSSENNHGLGINIVLRRALLNQAGGIQFIPDGAFGDSDRDDHIDLEDWAKLQRCFSGWADVVEDDSCRLLDFNTNGHIDTDDQAMFLDVMAGPLQQ